MSSLEQKTQALANLLQSRKQAKSPTSQKIKERPTSALMSDQQKRIWLHEKQVEMPLYNLPLVLKLTGEIHVLSLQHTIDEMIQCQDSLRTIFKIQDGLLIQEIQTHTPITIEFQDSQLESNTHIEKVIKKTISQPFDLAHGPLLRLKILQTDEQEWIFILVMHHIIGDGHSLKIIVETLFQKKYEKLNKQYIDYSLAQQKLLTTSTYQDKIYRWKAVLKDLPILRMPTEFSRKMERTYWGKCVSCTLPPMLFKKLSTFLKHENFSFFQYSLSIFSILISHYSQQKDFAIAIATANRTDEELEKIIGFFANTVPCRFRIDTQSCFKEFCLQVQQALFELLDNQEIPFETLAHCAQIERETGFPPLAQVMFVFRAGLESVLKNTALTTKYLDYHNDIALFDMLVTVTETNDTSLLSIDYNADLFTAEMMRAFLNTYVELLEKISTLFSESINTILFGLAKPVITIKKVLKTSSDTFISPLTPVEREIADTLIALWKKVLKIDTIHVDDAFLSLGGHSIVAMVLANNISSIFNIELPLIRLFDRPTIALLSKEISKLQTGKKSLVGLSKIPEDAEIPLSFSQEKLWRFHLIEKENTSYHLGAITRFKGQVDEDALQAALISLLQHYEAFSIRLKRNGLHNVSVKKIPPEKPILQDYTIFSEYQKEIALEKLKKQLMTTPYRLDEGNAPWSLTMIKWDDNQTILVFGGHHLFFDAWSFNILVNALVNRYQSYLQGTVSSDNTDLIDYSDYAYWQRAHAETQWEEQKAYWKTQLQNYLPLELPTDFPPKSIETYEGQRIEICPENSVIEQANAKAIVYQCTPFSLYLSAFALTLSYFCGQEEFVFVIPFANRNIPGLNNIVGHFVNVLPFRVILNKNDSKEQFMEKIQETLHCAQQNQNIFIDDTPIRALFNYISLTNKVMASGNVSIETEPLRPMGSKYDFSFTIENKTDKSLFLLDYNSDLFNSETIQFIHELYHYFLNALINTKSAETIHDIFLQHYLETSQKAKSQPTIPSNRLCQMDSLYAAFVLQAEKNPSSLALSDFNKSLSYRQLHADIEQKKEIIAALSISSGQFIGIAMKDPLQIVSAIFAVLAAGHCYVPLTQHYTEKQFEAIVADAEIQWILRDDFTLQRTSLNPLQTHNPNHPEKLAYLLYTSGSTGKPKAVMQSEKNVLQHIANYSEQLCVETTDHFLQLASFNFDAAVMDLYGALLNGCALYIADVNQLGLSATVKNIITHKITIYHSTPSLFRRLFDTKNDSLSFPDLRLIVLGGEAVFAYDFDIYKKTFSPHCTLINGYGPSECTIALQNKTSHHDQVPIATMPIGYPMPDTDIYLFNEKKQLSGLIGEIAIASPALVKGYCKQPDLTGRVFIRWGKTNTPLYLTGDLAKRLPDGRFIFLGRRDSEIKIRGFKVNLTLIESLLKKYLHIQNAVIVPQTLPNQEVRLHAFYLVKEGSCVHMNDVRHHLEKEIPYYMMPDLLHEISEFSYTDSGKIDRKALLESIASKEYIETASQDELSDMEKKMFLLWQEVLDNPDLHIHQNFFDLGGNSLQLLYLHKIIEESLEQSIPLFVLFQHSTIASFSHYLTKTISEEMTDTKKTETLYQKRINYLHYLKNNAIQVSHHE